MLLKALPPALLRAENRVSPQSSVNYNKPKLNPFSFTFTWYRNRHTLHLSLFYLTDDSITLVSDQINDIFYGQDRLLQMTYLLFKNRNFSLKSSKLYYSWRLETKKELPQHDNLGLPRDWSSEYQASVLCWRLCISHSGYTLQWTPVSPWQRKKETFTSFSVVRIWKQRRRSCL